MTARFRPPRHRSQALGALAVASLLGACGGSAGPEAEITATRTASLPSRPVIPGAGAQVRFGSPGGMGMGRSAADAPSDDLIDYDLPSGWKALAATSDRMINLQPAGDPEASCYLSFLQGSAGGLEANVNRWRKQLGAEPLSGAEVAALPTVSMLGRDATLVEVEGTYSGMGGSAPRAGFKLLGLLVSEAEGSLFLKLTGPAPLVTMEHERFLEFARSLRVADAHGSGGAMSGGAGAMDGGAGGGGHLHWQAPVSWSEQGPRPMRDVTFAVDGGGECYIARLPGDAGGLEANLDRWCVQFGQDKLTAAAFQALPRAKVLGIEVPVLELEGSFTGMDGSTASGQALLGVACIRGGESVFVKLTGPAEVVQRERENFLAFVRSLEEDR